MPLLLLDQKDHTTRTNNFGSFRGPRRETKNRGGSWAVVAIVYTHIAWHERAAALEHRYQTARASHSLLRCSLVAECRTRQHQQQQRGPLHVCGQCKPCKFSSLFLSEVSKKEQARNLTSPGAHTPSLANSRKWICAKKAPACNRPLSR